MSLKGEDIFLLWQNWGYSSLVVAPSVSRWSVIDLRPVHYEFLEDEDGGLGCRGGGAGAGSLAECVRDYVKRRAEEEMKCLPSMLSTFIDMDLEVYPKQFMFCLARHLCQFSLFLLLPISSLPVRFLFGVGWVWI